ncbi:MAG: hypothetical protein IPN27_00125 [Cellvibrionales bacterium]|nr:hypothetical protein [Cellvibrionales bacterium]
MSASLPARHAISRAEFFCNLANKCSSDERDNFEAFLEASIIFGRSVMYHLQFRHGKSHHWGNWWNSMAGNPAVEFFRQYRDVVVKEGSPKVGQRIGFSPVSSAAELYYFEPAEAATRTVEKHLATMKEIVKNAENYFASGTP